MKADKINWKAPEGMNTDLFKVFQKYRPSDSAMLCMWYNGKPSSEDPNSLTVVKDLSIIVHSFIPGIDYIIAGKFKHVTRSIFILYGTLSYTIV
jgi:hypothetical protein